MITIGQGDIEYGALVYMDSQTWDSGIEKYRFDIVKQKNGQIIETVAVYYADSLNQAMKQAIEEIQRRKNKKRWKQNRR